MRKAALVRHFGIPRRQLFRLPIQPHGRARVPRLERRTRLRQYFARLRARHAPCHSASLSYVGGTMKLDKFTVKAQEALQESQAIARKRDQQEILPEHILAALLAQQDGLVAPLLQRVGAEPALVQQRLDEELRKTPSVH